MNTSNNNNTQTVAAKPMHTRTTGASTPVVLVSSSILLQSVSSSSSPSSTDTTTKHDKQMHNVMQSAPHTQQQQQLQLQQQHAAILQQQHQSRAAHLEQQRLELHAKQLALHQSQLAHQQEVARIQALSLLLPEPTEKEIQEELEREAILIQQQVAQELSSLRSLSQWCIWYRYGFYHFLPKESLMNTQGVPLNAQQQQQQAVPMNEAQKAHQHKFKMPPLDLLQIGRGRLKLVLKSLFSTDALRQCLALICLAATHAPPHHKQSYYAQTYLQLLHQHHPDTKTKTNAIDEDDASIRARKLQPQGLCYFLLLREYTIPLLKALCQSPQSMIRGHAACILSLLTSTRTNLLCISPHIPSLESLAFHIALHSRSSATATATTAPAAAASSQDAHQTQLHALTAAYRMNQYWREFNPIDLKTAAEEADADGNDNDQEDEEDRESSEIHPLSSSSTTASTAAPFPSSSTMSPFYPSLSSWSLDTPLFDLHSVLSEKDKDKDKENHHDEDLELDHEALDEELEDLTFRMTQMVIWGNIIPLEEEEEDGSTQSKASGAASATPVASHDPKKAVAADSSPIFLLPPAVIEMLLDCVLGTDEAAASTESTAPHPSHHHPSPHHPSRHPYHLRFSNVLVYQCERLIQSGLIEWHLKEKLKGSGGGGGGGMSHQKHSRIDYANLSDTQLMMSPPPVAAAASAASSSSSSFTAAPSPPFASAASATVQLSTAQRCAFISLLILSNLSAQPQHQPSLLACKRFLPTIVALARCALQPMKGEEHSEMVSSATLNKILLATASNSVISSSSSSHPLSDAPSSPSSSAPYSYVARLFLQSLTNLSHHPSCHYTLLTECDGIGSMLLDYCLTGTSYFYLHPLIYSNHQFVQMTKQQHHNPHDVSPYQRKHNKKGMQQYKTGSDGKRIRINSLHHHNDDEDIIFGLDPDPDPRCFFMLSSVCISNLIGLAHQQQQSPHHANGNNGIELIAEYLKPDQHLSTVAYRYCQHLLLLHSHPTSSTKSVSVSSTTAAAATPSSPDYSSLSFDALIACLCVASTHVDSTSSRLLLMSLVRLTSLSTFRLQYELTADVIESCLTCMNSHAVMDISNYATIVLTNLLLHMPINPPPDHAPIHTCILQLLTTYLGVLETSHDGALKYLSLTAIDRLLQLSSARSVWIRLGTAAPLASSSLSTTHPHHHISKHQAHHLITGSDALKTIVSHCYLPVTEHLPLLFAALGTLATFLLESETEGGLLLSMMQQHLPLILPALLHLAIQPNIALHRHASRVLLRCFDAEHPDIHSLLSLNQNENDAVLELLFRLLNNHTTMNGETTTTTTATATATAVGDLPLQLRALSLLTAIAAFPQYQPRLISRGIVASQVRWIMEERRGGGGGGGGNVQNIHHSNEEKHSSSSSSSSPLPLVLVDEIHLHALIRDAPSLQIPAQYHSESILSHLLISPSLIRIRAQMFQYYCGNGSGSKDNNSGEHSSKFNNTYPPLLIAQLFLAICSSVAQSIQLIEITNQHTTATAAAAASTATMTKSSKTKQKSQTATVSTTSTLSTTPSSLLLSSSLPSSSSSSSISSSPPLPAIGLAFDVLRHLIDARILEALLKLSATQELLAKLSSGDENSSSASAVSSSSPLLVSPTPPSLHLSTHRTALQSLHALYPLSLRQFQTGLYHLPTRKQLLQISMKLCGSTGTMSAILTRVEMGNLLQQTIGLIQNQSHLEMMLSEEGCYSLDANTNTAGKKHDSSSSASSSASSSSPSNWMTLLLESLWRPSVPVARGDSIQLHLITLLLHMLNIDTASSSITSTSPTHGTALNSNSHSPAINRIRFEGKHLNLLLGLITTEIPLTQTSSPTNAHKDKKNKNKNVSSHSTPLTSFQLTALHLQRLSLQLILFLIQDDVSYRYLLVQLGTIQLLMTFIQMSEKNSNNNSENDATANATGNIDPVHAAMSKINPPSLLISMSQEILCYLFQQDDILLLEMENVHRGYDLLLFLLPLSQKKNKEKGRKKEQGEGGGKNASKLRHLAAHCLVRLALHTDKQKMKASSATTALIAPPAAASASSVPSPATMTTFDLNTPLGKMQSTLGLKPPEINAHFQQIQHQQLHAHIQQQLLPSQQQQQDNQKQPLKEKKQADNSPLSSNVDDKVNADGNGLSVPVTESSSHGVPATSKKASAGKSKRSNPPTAATSVVPLTKNNPPAPVPASSNSASVNDIQPPRPHSAGKRTQQQQQQGGGGGGGGAPEKRPTAQHFVPPLVRVKSSPKLSTATTTTTTTGTDNEASASGNMLHKLSAKHHTVDTHKQQTAAAQEMKQQDHHPHPHPHPQQHPQPQQKHAQDHNQPIQQKQHAASEQKKNTPKSSTTPKAPATAVVPAASSAAHPPSHSPSRPVIPPLFTSNNGSHLLFGASASASSSITTTVAATTVTTSDGLLPHQKGSTGLLNSKLVTNGNHPHAHAHDAELGYEDDGDFILPSSSKHPHRRGNDDSNNSSRISSAYVSDEEITMHETKKVDHHATQKKATAAHPQPTKTTAHTRPRPSAAHMHDDEHYADDFS